MACICQKLIIQILSLMASNKTFDFELFNRVFRYVNPYKKLFYLTTSFAILLAFLSPSRPLLIQYAFDNFILIPNQQKLLHVSFLLVGLLVVESVAQYFYTYWANLLGQTVIKDIRMETYQKILHFKQSYFDKTPIGSLVTRVVSDIETIADIFSQGLLVIIADILKLVVVLVVMFVTDWKLTLFLPGFYSIAIDCNLLVQKVHKNSFSASKKTGNCFKHLCSRTPCWHEYRSAF